MSSNEMACPRIEDFLGDGGDSHHASYDELRLEGAEYVEEEREQAEIVLALGASRGWRSAPRRRATHAQAAAN